jgi:demethylmenaquinone methyltransferase/2-methoxy-6-polyprenyl-1,4-benzoquinol methylase
MISPEDKQSAEPRDGSGQMFDGIAGRYDLLNRVISLGIDQRWRRRTVDALGLTSTEPARVVDLATGTGALAILIAERYPNTQVLGIDPSRNMMAIGEQKVAARNLTSRITFKYGDAQALPLEDDSVDGLTMAFGIRNVPDRLGALREMLRVLRPGAKAAILELSEPPPGLFGALGRFHMHQVVPRVGALLSGEREYRYLPQSIAAFPAPTAFADLMQEAGFVTPRITPFTFGVCQLFVGQK